MLGRDGVELHQRRVRTPKDLGQGGPEEPVGGDFGQRLGHDGVFVESELHHPSEEAVVV